jgi:hypothetical protein
MVPPIGPHPKLPLEHHLGAPVGYCYFWRTTFGALVVKLLLAHHLGPPVIIWGGARLGVTICGSLNTITNLKNNQTAQHFRVASSHVTLFMKKYQTWNLAILTSMGFWARVNGVKLGYVFQHPRSFRM